LRRRLYNINHEVKAIRGSWSERRAGMNNLSDDEWIAAENAKLEAKFKAFKKA